MASDRAYSKLDTNVPDALDARVDAISDWKDGTAAAIRIALIAITTNISTKVKPRKRIDNLLALKLIQTQSTKRAHTAQWNLFGDGRVRARRNKTTVQKKEKKKELERGYFELSG